MPRFTHLWKLSALMIGVCPAWAFAQQYPVTPSLQPRPYQASQWVANPYGVSSVPRGLVVTPQQGNGGQAGMAPVVSPNAGLRPDSRQPASSSRPQPSMEQRAAAAGPQLKSSPQQLNALPPRIDSSGRPNQVGSLANPHEVPSNDRSSTNPDGTHQQKQSRVTYPQLLNVPEPDNLSVQGMVHDLQFEPNLRLGPQFREWQNMYAPQNIPFAFSEIPRQPFPPVQYQMAPNNYYGPESQRWSNILRESVTPHVNGSWNYSPW